MCVCVCVVYIYIERERGESTIASTRRIYHGETRAAHEIEVGSGDIYFITLYWRVFVHLHSFIELTSDLHALNCLCSVCPESTIKTIFLFL